MFDKYMYSAASLYMYKEGDIMLNVSRSQSNQSLMRACYGSGIARYQR